MSAEGKKSSVMGSNHVHTALCIVMVSCKEERSEGAFAVFECIRLTMSLM